MFIEFTNAYNNQMLKNRKFCLNKEHILYFAECLFLSNNTNYENCNSYIETFGSSEGSQLYYVQETYDEIKEKLNA